MKRFHVHLHVQGLARSIDFYSQLFNARPAGIEVDYAKWMLDDPAVNFAISTRDNASGVDHLGIQTEGAEDLAELKVRAEAAGMTLRDEGNTTCCYARSEKHWVTDLQDIDWEYFNTLESIPVFRETLDSAGASPACYTPLPHPARACCASADRTSPTCC